MSMFLLLNPSSLTNASYLENTELEQSSVKDKSLHMYKKMHSTAYSDPKIVPMSHVSILDAQSSENPIVSSSVFLWITFILILINLLPFEKANGVFLNIVYIIYVLCSYSSFYLFISSFDYQVCARGPIKLRLEVYYARGWRSIMKEEMAALE